MLLINDFPPWWSFLIESYRMSSPTLTLVVIHTGPRPDNGPNGASPLDERHIRYVHMLLDALISRFESILGVGRKQASDKISSGKGLSDLKPFYGAVFEDELRGYTHWGWVDWDVFMGDLVGVIGAERFWEYDAITAAGATLGFAWAGQLTIFRQTAETRSLYTTEPSYLDSGFYHNQSGWEERLFLVAVLRSRPHLSILFQMGAQMDHKAMWLTHVPFDHYWHHGRIWRCMASSQRRGMAPPLLLANETAWREDVLQIQRDPRAFYARERRVCIRWDLKSSPWMCCPHSLGVNYQWQRSSNGSFMLSGEKTGYRKADADVLRELNAAPEGTGVRVRVNEGYQLCHEGGFFHSGLRPQGAQQPPCADSTWALLDGEGRFKGDLRVLRERCVA